MCVCVCVRHFFEKFEDIYLFKGDFCPAGKPVGGQSVPSVDFVNQAKLSGETSSVDQSVQLGSMRGVPDIQQIKTQVALVAVWVRET